MAHTNPIATELCQPYVNENGKKIGGAAAFNHNVKEAGGIDHVIDAIQYCTIKAMSATMFSDTIASEKRAQIQKTG